MMGPLILSLSLTFRLSVCAILEGYAFCVCVLCVCVRACVCSKAREYANKKMKQICFPKISIFSKEKAMTMTTTTTLSRRPIVVVVAAKKRRKTPVVVLAATSSSGKEEEVFFDVDEEKKKKQNSTTTTTTNSREYYEGFFKSPLGEQSVDGNDDGGRRRDSIAPTIKFALNSSLVVGALLVLFLASNGLL